MWNQGTAASAGASLVPMLSTLRKTTSLVTALTPHAAFNPYVTNIKGQVEDAPGLQLNGVRATRARFPNLPGGIEVSPGYDDMISGNSASWTPPDLNKYGPVKFYTDEIPEHRRNTTDNWFNNYMIGVCFLECSCPARAFRLS